MDDQIEMILTIMDGIVEFICILIRTTIAVLVFITTPIWIIPYIIYENKQEEENKKYIDYTM